MPTTITELKQRQDTKDAASAKLGESHEVTGNTWEVSIPRTRICTLEQLIEHCRVDLNTWSVTRFTCNKWEMGAKNQDTGKIEVEPLFQIKAFLERKVAATEARAEIEALKSDAMTALAKTKFAPVGRNKTQSGNMLEISTYDLHVGKLAWSEETGGSNYDSKIAVDLYWRAFNALVERVSHYKFDQVLLVIGNDLLNSDDSEGRTTAGTYVTTDQRYQKTFNLVRDLKIESILRLRAQFKCRVKVVLVPGNHDSQSIWALGNSLECFFHSCPEVEIDNLPRVRKYVQWGKGMILLTHGNKGKRADYPLVMATENPQMFAATKYREAHTGHLHTKQINEYHGVRVRILSALCSADAWHSANFFVGNLRSAEAFIWNKDEGIIGTAEFTVFDDEEQQ